MEPSDNSKEHPRQRRRPLNPRLDVYKASQGLGGVPHERRRHQHRRFLDDGYKPFFFTNIATGMLSQLHKCVFFVVEGAASLFISPLYLVLLYRLGLPSPSQLPKPFHLMEAIRVLLLLPSIPPLLSNRMQILASHRSAILESRPLYAIRLDSAGGSAQEKLGVLLCKVLESEEGEGDTSGPFTLMRLKMLIEEALAAARSSVSRPSSGTRNVGDALKAILTELNSPETEVLPEMSAAISALAIAAESGEGFDECMIRINDIYRRSSQDADISYDGSSFESHSIPLTSNQDGSTEMIPSLKDPTRAPQPTGKKTIVYTGTGTAPTPRTVSVKSRAPPRASQHVMSELSRRLSKASPPNSTEILIEASKPIQTDQKQSARDFKLSPDVLSELQNTKSNEAPLPLVG